MTDPGEDRIARLELLAKLDTPPEHDYGRALDPAYRTIDGRPLNDAEADLLLACTIDDMDHLTEELNRQAELRTRLAAVIREYTELVRPFMRGDGDERALIRMPINSRRAARKLQNQMRELRLETGFSED